MTEYLIFLYKPMVTVNFFFRSHLDHSATDDDVRQISGTVRYIDFLYLEFVTFKMYRKKTFTVYLKILQMSAIQTSILSFKKCVLSKHFKPDPVPESALGEKFAKNTWITLRKKKPIFQ